MDPYVQALIQLISAEGGYEAVAAKADVNAQSLYQICSGVKLPSGNPKGVGPKIRRNLDAAYPGWSSLASAPPPKNEGPTPPPPSAPGHPFRAPTEDEMRFLEDVRNLLDTDREHYVKEIAAKADQMRAHWVKIMSDLKGKEKP